MSDTRETDRRIRTGERLINFTGAVLLISAGVKFLHPLKAVNYMVFLGYADEKLFLIAAIELLTAVLFLYRPTRIAGAMLVSAYFGGAIAAHLADHPLTGSAPIILFNYHHHYLGTLPAVVVLVSAWLGLSLSNPNLFHAVGTRRMSDDFTSRRPSERIVRAS
jgi:hypothetical protein